MWSHPTSQRHWRPGDWWGSAGGARLAGLAIATMRNCPGRGFKEGEEAALEDEGIKQAEAGWV